MRKTILRKVLFKKIDENTVGHPSSVPKPALVRLGAKLGPKINAISFIFLLYCIFNQLAIQDCLTSPSA